MKALVGAFNQEKALVGAFSVIVQPVVEPMEHKHSITQDVLTVSSPGAVPAPRLCGTNHGYHLYVEVGGEDCAQLSLTQGSIAATREWDITITQVVCPGGPQQQGERDNGQ